MLIHTVNQEKDNIFKCVACMTQIVNCRSHTRIVKCMNMVLDSIEWLLKKLCPVQFYFILFRCFIMKCLVMER